MILKVENAGLTLAAGYESTPHPRPLSPEYRNAVRHEICAWEMMV
jgi:hypothetical protein